MGLTYKAIAARHCIAISTVKTHLSRVFRKRKVTSSLDLQRKNCSCGCRQSEDLCLMQMRIIQRKIQRMLHASDRFIAASKCWPIYRAQQPSRSYAFPAPKARLCR
jgi:hypothetical protein